MTALRIIDDHIELASIGSNTHAQIDSQLTSLKNISDDADSPMIVTGGEISDGTNANTFKVAALTALLRSTNSATGALVEVSLAEQDNQAITVVDTIYRAHLNYNGGSPTISISGSNLYDTDKRSIPIGRVMRDSSNVVHTASTGYRFQDGVQKLHELARAVRSLALQSGATISYTGTNNFITTEGIIYGGINSFTVAIYDSSGITFSPVYRAAPSGWTYGAASNVIDFEHYDDGTGTLNTIGNNKYGCFWVYMHIDGHVYVVYGRDSYTLAEAETAPEPSKPDHLVYFGALLGCIIAPQSGGSFTEVQMVTDTFFSGTSVSNHNDLGGLDGGAIGGYYHLTSTELTNLGNQSGVNTGDQDLSGLVTKALFDANTLLKADADDTPAALTVGEQTLVGRITAGDIAALTPAQIRTLINVEDGAAADQTKVDIDALGLSHDSLSDVSTDDHHAEAHSIASHNDTTATGAELETLTNNSIADALHRHSELVASDGSPDPALQADATGQIGIGVTPLARGHIKATTAFDPYTTTLSGDTLFLENTSEGTGDNNIGAALTLGGPGRASTKMAAIAAVETTADADQGGLAFYVDDSANTGNNLTEAVRIDHNSVVILAKGQIKFPATAVPSSDANTLDDYEEGTYEPTITGSTSGSYVMATNKTFAYTKIGRTVHLAGELAITSASSPVGNLHVSIPFTCLQLTGIAERVFTMVFLSDHGGSLPNGVFASIYGANDYFGLIQLADNGTAHTLDNADVDTAWALGIDITYLAA